MTHLRLSTILSKLAEADDYNGVLIYYDKDRPRNRRYSCTVEVNHREKIHYASNYDHAARKLAYELRLIPHSEVNPQGGEKNG